jgi:hydroxymethylbilane synthase
MSGVHLRLGTRRSPLALAQSTMMALALEARHPGLRVGLVHIATTGDALQQGGTKPDDLTKAIFTKEIEEALLAGSIDLAVHSSKDLAAGMPEGLDIAAFPHRGPASDVLVSKTHPDQVLEQSHPVLATGSARRRFQWLEKIPGTEFCDLRGNIDTRLRRLRDTTAWDGIILAQAGLERLRPDMSGLHVRPLPHAWMLPAPGQGALALQVRADDDSTRQMVRVLDDDETRRAVEAERIFLAAMGAGCDTPLGALATRSKEGDLWRLDAVLYEEEGSAWNRRAASVEGPDPKQLGAALAQTLGA